MRSLAAIGIALFALLLASPAGAHSDFRSSTPADGDVVDTPVSEIVLVFASRSQPSGEGFVALDGDGVIRIPGTVESDDDRTWRIGFDEPLTGTIGVRWTITAADGHANTGSFSFTSTAPPPTTTTTTTTIAPTTTVAAGDPSTTTTTTVVPTTTTTAAPEVEPIDLDEFLDTSGPAPTRSVWIQRAGQLLSLAGFVAMAGLAVAARWIMPTAGDARRRIQDRVLSAGLLLGVGAGLEGLGLLDADGAWALGDVLDVATSGNGFAVALRLLAAAAIVYALRLPESWREAWVPPLVLAAAGAAAVSFAFDGHTASKGARALHAVTNVVHTSAVAIWVGGVLALLIATRVGTDATALRLAATRFSTVATIVLIAAAVTGLAMTGYILDSPGDLTGTDFGRVLIAKVVAVAVAGACGLYNHRVLVPAIENDEPTAADRLRRSLTIEAGAFAVVVVATVTLINASPI